MFSAGDNDAPSKERNKNSSVSCYEQGMFSAGDNDAPSKERNKNSSFSCYEQCLFNNKKQ